MRKIGRVVFGIAVGSCAFARFLLACASENEAAAGASVDASVDASGNEAASGSSVDASADATDCADACASPRLTGPCNNLPPKTLVSSSGPDWKLVGEPAPSDAGPYLGTYYPSFWYPADASVGVLSYTTTAVGDAHTRVATSSDHGATFTWVAEPNHGEPLTVTTTDTSVCGKTTCPVTMFHEVSSIVVDAADPDANARIKLFVHSYASYGSSTLRRDWGYIGRYTAPAPAGPWSAETKLLGWNSSATLSTVATQILTTTPALADCIAFTEPGATVTSHGLDLALTCLSLADGTVSQRIVLLRSTDHGATFRYVGPLVAAPEAACLASTTKSATGADLFTVGDKEYVIVTPFAPVTPNPIAPTGVDYAGCLVIPFADATAGTLERIDGGAPAVTRWMAADDGRFTGPCTFAEGAGYLTPMVGQLPAPIFHVKVSPPDF